MTLPRKPVRGDTVHARAIARLVAAVDDRERLSQEGETAPSGPAARTAAVAVAEANEHVAARQAWVHYIERGY